MQQDVPQEPLSLTRQMRDMTPEQRREIMRTAAEMLADYYRTDPEVLEWCGLDAEKFYDEPLSRQHEVRGEHP